MPALPKHPSTRARRNKVAGARTLSIVHDVETPALPDLTDFDDFEWHSMTQSWWRDIWASPMAPEFDTSDVHGLYVLAMLVDQFWTQPTASLAGEIRLQRQCFGLTPIDRRKLQWEIDRAEQADQATQQRRNQAAVQAAQQTGPPPPSATKKQWVGWIETVHRVPAATLNASTKQELISEYGPGAATADARDALMV